MKLSLRSNNLITSYPDNDANPQIKIPALISRHIDNSQDIIFITELVVSSQVEAGLFPVSRSVAWASGELDWEMAVAELNIKIGRQALNIHKY